MSSSPNMSTEGRKETYIGFPAIRLTLFNFRPHPAWLLSWTSSHMCECACTEQTDGARVMNVKKKKTHKCVENKFQSKLTAIMDEKVKIPIKRGSGQRMCAAVAAILCDLWNCYQTGYTTAQSKRQFGESCSRKTAFFSSSFPRQHTAERNQL